MYKLDYLFKGERETQILDNSYFDKLNEVFSFSHEILDQLIIHLKGEIMQEAKEKQTDKSGEETI